MNTHSWHNAFFSLRAPHGLLLVALIAVMVFGYEQAQPALRDPDAFYHAAVTEEMLESGLLHAFPWLPHTVIATAYPDHHFLYHVALAPFVAVFGGEAGVKIASLIFAVVSMLVLYGVLRRIGARYPTLFTSLVVLTASFAFRIDLGKATPLSLIILLLAFEAVVSRTPRRAFILAALFVWTHAAWPLMLVLAFAGVAGSFLVKSDGKELRVSASALVGGVCAGLVVNPWFPGNIRFYWEQIVQVAFIGHPAGVPSGTEWLAPSIPRLLSTTAPASIAVALGLIALVYATTFPEQARQVSKQKVLRKALPIGGILVAILLVMTLRQERHVEYLIPIAVLFASLCFAVVDPKTLVRETEKFFGRWAYIIVIFVGTALTVSSVTGITRVRDAYDRGVPFARYEAVSLWMADNVPDGMTVVHAGWDDFPMLFNHYRDGRFVVGVDPMFLYRAPGNAFDDWVSLDTDGGPIVSTSMTQTFASDILLVMKDEAVLMHKAEQDPMLTLVYSDHEASVFKRIAP